MNSPTRSTPCSDNWSRTSPSSRGSPRTPPTNCAPRWPSRGRCWTSPASPTRNRGELLARLQAVNTRAIDLTEALLLLSGSDRGNFTRESVDLSLVAEEAAETLLPLAEQRGITLDVTGGATRTSGCAELLLRMVTNLLQNAIVHNLPACGTVTLHTEAQGDASVLRVENTGRPLPPELVPTLTEPFQRGTERVRTDEHAGVGLGLAIVRSIVRAHDGTLDLVPRPAGGLLVTVRLPGTP
ncbi:putative Signal transduction histidine kinase-like protein [Streptomyces viridochromogenes Tue57]|uniref:histidine kinase n=1 Tax=Streptomyces viridochromogenes Tue57 TaxID=1160705 RepID=L8NZF6_STRVR|nr:putative Signal transduction histidine kinase-like protein [Streptomyces viridochromogenes Tue57]